MRSRSAQRCRPGSTRARGVAVGRARPPGFRRARPASFPSTVTPEAVRAAARLALAERPIDVDRAQPDARRKKLLIADMDSTMIDQECIDELAAEVGLKARGRRHHRARHARRDRLRASAARTGRAAEGPSDDVGREHARRERIALMPGAATWSRTMRGHGARTALVSGGFTAFTGPVAPRSAFTRSRQPLAQRRRAAHRAGRRADPWPRGQGGCARSSRGALGLTPAETLAVGDGANDLDMIRRAGLGVAFHAKPVAAQPSAGATSTTATLPRCSTCRATGARNSCARVVGSATELPRRPRRISRRATSRPRSCSERSGASCRRRSTSSMAVLRPCFFNSSIRATTSSGFDTSRLADLHDDLARLDALLLRLTAGSDRGDEHAFDAAVDREGSSAPRR